MDLAAVSTLISLATAATVLVNFFMQRGKAEGNTAEATSQIAVIAAKLELLRGEHHEFKEFVAREHVAVKALDKLEQRLTLELHRISDESNRRFDEMARTLVEVVALAPGIKRPPLKT